MSSQGTIKIMPLVKKPQHDNTKWLVLAVFCITVFGNSLFWVTFAPISDITEDYIGGNTFNNVTSVNMLANIFLILFLPGTWFGNLVRKQYGMRQAMIICCTITVLGAILRFIPSLFHDQMNSSLIYLLLLSGQMLAAISQPFFCNIPPAVACIWFPVAQRDLATTIGFFFNPIGNALGETLAAAFVTQSIDPVTNESTVSGMSLLLGIELIICVLALLLTYFFFQDAPKVPPSTSAKLIEQVHYLVLSNCCFYNRVITICSI